MGITHGPGSHNKPGVPQGTLSDKLTLTSQIYDGMQSDYWVYVPFQYNPQIPAALMVWQDGHFYIDRDSPTLRALDAIDNLIHQKQIPLQLIDSSWHRVSRSKVKIRAISLQPRWPAKLCILPP